MGVYAKKILKQYLENGNVFEIVFADFRKALYSISHENLMMKVQAADISGTLMLQWKII